jgi:hypothetical protein
LNQAALHFLVYQGGFFSKVLVLGDVRYEGRLWSPAIQENFQLTFSENSVDALFLAYQLYLETAKELTPRTLPIKIYNGDILICYLIKRHWKGDFPLASPLWDLVQGEICEIEYFLAPDFQVIWNYLDLFLAKAFVKRDEELWGLKEFELWQGANQKRIWVWTKLLEGFVQAQRYSALSPFLYVFEILFRKPLSMEDHQIKYRRFTSEAKRHHLAEMRMEEIATFYEIGIRLQEYYQNFLKISYIERTEEIKRYMELYQHHYLPIEGEVKVLYSGLKRQRG